ncbi:MAG: Gfo/Idh/MocA family oxidoreductase [Armatimonadetes bacterium]|nr:Gfo/Idh/MocA family oxidoreductase [Armatimonadota bacterium]
MEKIRYGLIGAGQMACGHLGCIRAIPYIELVAVADPSELSLNVFQHVMADPDALNAPGKGLAQRYRELEAAPPPPVEGGTKLLSDYRELLALPEVDAVVIATPDCTHVDIVEDCLAAGKHVLSEKPAATSHEQLRQLEAAVTGSDRVYQVGLECRYLPAYRRMRRMVEEGAIGKPVMTWCMEFRGPFLEKRGNWILRQDQTGGVFVEKTCHFFDLMTWFVDSTPRQVTAVAGQDVVKNIYGVTPDIFDNGWVIIEYENGARGMLGLCMFGGRHPLSVSVLGDAGQMDGDYASQKIDYLKLGQPGVEVIDAGADHEYAHLSHKGGVYLEHLAFIENIRTGRVPLTGLNEAKWSTLVGLATPIAYESWTSQMSASSAATMFLAI